MVLLLSGWPGFLYAHGSHGQLMAAVDRQLEEAPGNGRLWFRRACLNIEHGDWEQALTDLDKTESLLPDELPTLLKRGQALKLAGRLEDAKAALDSHIARYPRDASGRATRAGILRKLGAASDALADYRAAISLSADIQPDLIQETALAMAENGLANEAIEVLDEGMKRLGQVPSLLLKALEIEAKSGRFDSALARVEAMRKSAPRPEPWMAKRAGLLAQAGRIAESRDAWQALFEHIQGLPNLERGSNAMQTLSEQAQQALRAHQTSVDSKPLSIAP